MEVGVALSSDATPVLVTELALSVTTWEFPALLVLAISVESEATDEYASVEAAGELDAVDDSTMATTGVADDDSVELLVSLATEGDPVKVTALSLLRELEIAELEAIDGDDDSVIADELELRTAAEVLLTTVSDSATNVALGSTLALLSLLEVICEEALELLDELSNCEIEALELLTTDCELKPSKEEETADEVSNRLTLLGPALEMTDADDEELAVCAEAA